MVGQSLENKKKNNYYKLCLNTKKMWLLIVEVV